MQSDIVKQKIKEFLEKTTLHMGVLSVADDDDTNALWFSIETNEPHLFIGKNGETLQALNHLARKIAEKHLLGTETFTEIIVDVNEYQNKKIDSLKAIAHMMAERARFFKSSVDVEPMSAYDRKIIHSYLSSKNDIVTESVGEGMSRHIVIKYVENKPL